MTEILHNFDGTPGQAVQVGQNGVYELNTGVPYYTSDKKFGTASIRTGNPPSATAVRYRVDLGAISGDHYGAIYLKNPTAHGSGTSHVSFFHLVTSNGQWIAELRASPSNAMSIRSNSVDIRSGVINEIPINQWFRLEWRVAGTGGATPTFYWRLFQNADSTTPDISGSYGITGITTPAESLMLGAFSSNATITKDWQHDLVRASDTATDWLGPYVETTPTEGITVWTGAQEVPIQSITVWNGTAEVPATFDTVT